MKLRLAQSFCFILWCSSALTAQTTKAIDVELHNVSLAEALKDLEDNSYSVRLQGYRTLSCYLPCRGSAVRTDHTCNTGRKAAHLQKGA